MEKNTNLDMPPREPSRDYQHLPVMLEKTIEYLVTDQHGIYVDATFGRGGHSTAILNNLSPKGKLISIDKDREAYQVALDISQQDSRLIPKHGSFTKIKNWMEELNYQGKVSGILMDLGVSSTQLDNPNRGFSFNLNGPLDMRMNQEQTFNARDWINHAGETAIQKVFWEYGEERFSRRLAKSIIKERAQTPINTTKELAEIIAKAHPRWEKHKHPATRAFQAIRILINNELAELEDSLEQTLEALKINGRIALISFHSLEHQKIKNFIKKHTGASKPNRLPVTDQELNKRLKLLFRTNTSTDEIAANRRSRSAVLRVLEKTK